MSSDITTVGANRICCHGFADVRVGYIFMPPLIPLEEEGDKHVWRSSANKKGQANEAARKEENHWPWAMWWGPHPTYFFQLFVWACRRIKEKKCDMGVDIYGRLRQVGSASQGGK